MAYWNRYTVKPRMLFKKYIFIYIYESFESCCRFADVDKLGLYETSRELVRFPRHFSELGTKMCRIDNFIVIKWNFLWRIRTGIDRYGMGMMKLCLRHLRGKTVHYFQLNCGLQMADGNWIHIISVWSKQHQHRNVNLKSFLLPDATRHPAAHQEQYVRTQFCSCLPLPSYLW